MTFWKKKISWPTRNGLNPKSIINYPKILTLFKRTLIELQHIEDVGIRFFCNEAMNKNDNKLDICCTAFDTQNTILVKASKCFTGDYTLITEVLVIEKALGLALQEN